MLRTLIAVAETLPQFLVTYLKTLLSPSALPCKHIRQSGTDDDQQVRTMAERLDHAIVHGISIRHLIPLLSKAIVSCLDENADCQDNVEEIMVLLGIIRSAINNSSRNHLGPIIGKIVNASIQIYGYGNCDKSTRTELLTKTNDVLLALIMKLSEVQLRPLFAKLRHWRGDLKTSVVDKASMLRRESFYSLSAAISKELRSIFLPCMSSIIGDITEELEFAVSSICVATKQVKGSKRRKLEGVEPTDCLSLAPLQPLLLCLETTLKADAHEGGNWIRSEDGQRYRALLEPLGKLLSASVPAEFDTIIEFDSAAQKTIPTPYEKLVQGIGTDEYGSVIGCVTALANAAGNEQLWKPLNHSILEACGCDERSEVRKTGVKTLLSIIQTLGEEYMVLLPECLPILSELLEDEDDHIVFLAKECVRQGEELLGESLEDSLM